MWTTLVTDPAPTARKIKPSDLMDYLHCAYLPYVDLFSCDAATADLLIRMKSPFVDKVCRSPLEIRERLSLLNNPLCLDLAVKD